MRQLILAALGLSVAAFPAHAAIVYSNNFDGENGGNTQTNYTGFNGLTVTDGTVDLVRSGDFRITCPGGRGACVDLDGSTGDAGLTSSNSYAFGAGSRLELRFVFTGNQRGGASDSFTFRYEFAAPTTGKFGFTSDNGGSLGPISVTDSSVSFTLSGIGSNFSLTNVLFYFDAETAGSARFSFQDNGNDNEGIILDNVSFDVTAAVPEPASWAMMIAGFGLAGAAMRRKGRLALA